MSDRYFGKVVSTRGNYTVIANKGEEQGVKVGDTFLVVGLGEVIVDPDTGEELEKLEIVRGKVKVTHVQPKISTLESCLYEKSSDTKEIKKVTTKAGALLGMLGPQEAITESTIPGESRLKELVGARQGDYIIKL